MATSKQAKGILTQGKKIVATNRARTGLDIEHKSEESDDSQEELAQPMKGIAGKHDKRAKVIRPNAFLSFRITNQQIIDQASHLQKQIIESNPLLSKASVSIPTLHTTLLVFALKTEEDKKRARESLAEICHQISSANLSLPQISFTGLSHFNNKVLYIDPVKDAHLDALTRIAAICRETYEKNGIMATDTRPFNPHLTLFKLSKARDLHRKGVKKIDESWCSKYTDHHFGMENFQSLQLCNMLKKQTDGYYEIFHELNLFNNGLDSCRSLPPPLEWTNINEVMGINNVIASKPQVPDEQQTVITESSPLLPSDRPTYEEPFSGFASVLSYSRTRGCLCCSVT